MLGCQETPVGHRPPTPPTPTLPQEPLREDDGLVAGICRFSRHSLVVSLWELVLGVFLG